MPRPFGTPRLAIAPRFGILAAVWMTCAALPDLARAASPPAPATAAATPAAPATTKDTMGAAADTSRPARWRPSRDPSVATFLIVRHAEKNTALLGHDVPLAERGAARARELRRIAGDTAVDAIYATPTLRAMQTAQPLAEALGESLTVVHDTPEVVRRLKASHWGQLVVVVGHSDTVPQIVEGLTGTPVPAFTDEHDLLYVVTLTRDGHSSVVRLRYGDPS